MNNALSKSSARGMAANKIPYLTFLGLLLAAVPARAADTKLWYDQPASDWMTEALPIGNGDPGATVFGKTDVERIQFRCPCP